MIVISNIKLQWIMVVFGFTVFDKTTSCMAMKSEDIAGTEVDAFVGESISRFVRKTSELRDPYNANPMPRFVEMVIVYDNKAYMELNESLDEVLAHSKEVTNIVNSLYAPLNVFIALVETIVWSDFDKISVSPNSERTLVEFLRYRKTVLNQGHPNDNAQLITGRQFEGGVLGKALKGSICTSEYSGGVSTMHSITVGQLASLLAHHLGHNFGMEHDDDNCYCPESKCIMTPSFNSIIPIRWSSCSQRYISQSFERGLDYCLRNKPKIVLGPVCGNSFVEDGEECDCGLGTICDNPCCNATSCTFYANASCATGSCCHLPTCQVKPMHTLCRVAALECDHPEFCDGFSEDCPEDIFKQNSFPCGNGKAYCASGQCKSHDDQCKLLWGPSGKMSDKSCFEMNKKGNVNGNCGYFRANDTFKSCAEEDVLCGELHCTHSNDRLEFGLEAAAILGRTFIRSGGKVLPCRTAILDFGLYSIDPGLVPDGSKCGEDKMCFKQRCIPVVPIQSLPSPDERNGTLESGSTLLERVTSFLTSYLFG